ncbi:MAG TPA: hypothetical protein VLL97_07350 [Acidobacteriota bacterium]|nr:hypothetical protein [Acidobacteriota bacterium]
MEEICRIVMDKAPEGIIGWVMGIVMIISILAAGSKMKSIPFKIFFGDPPKNGKTYITKEELQQNCETRQHALDQNLAKILEHAENSNAKIDMINNRLSYIEGALDGTMGIRKPG